MQTGRVRDRVEALVCALTLVMVVACGEGRPAPPNGPMGPPVTPTARATAPAPSIPETPPSTAVASVALDSPAPTRACRKWPPADAKILSVLAVPAGLCLVFEPSIHPSSYDNGTVFDDGVGSPVGGRRHALAHELCHAHQHWVAMREGFQHIDDWVRTKQGKAWISAAGWKRRGSRWLEKPERFASDYPNPLEDNADYCAMWFDATNQFSEADMKRLAPKRYAWLRRWLPPPP
jgi:hypothetical protein